MRNSKSIVLAVLMGCVLIGVGHSAIAQEEAAPATPAPAAEEKKAEPEPAPAAQPTPKPAAEPQWPNGEKPVFRKRLPNYYNRVVNGVQKEDIYKIQETYFYQIALLKLQIAKLEAERDKKIDAVLSPEQLKIVEQMTADAKQARADKGAVK